MVKRKDIVALVKRVHAMEEAVIGLAEVVKNRHPEAGSRVDEVLKKWRKELIELMEEYGE